MRHGKKNNHLSRQKGHREALLSNLATSLILAKRITTTVGIFSRHKWDIELYRVKDSTVIEPFWQRLFGLGNIVITTNDTTTPSLTLEALPHAKDTREKLRAAIEECRDRKRVRIAELE